MEVGDRARALIAHGADPRAVADQSVVSPLYRRMAARDLRVRATMLLGGVTLTVVAGLACGFYRPTSAETVREHQLAEAGLGSDATLPADIQARLALSPQDVGIVGDLLTSQPSALPDMSWQAALSGQPSIVLSRKAALRDLLDIMAPLAPADRRAAMAQIAITANLTPLARSLMQALEDVPLPERQHVIALLAAIMRLPTDQRVTLERAGFPPLPADPDRQELYRRVASSSSEQAGFIYNLLSDASRFRALVRVDWLLKAHPIRRLLGAVADGALVVKDRDNLPSRCDIGVAGSCRMTP